MDEIYILKVNVVKVYVVATCDWLSSQEFNNCRSQALAFWWVVMN